MSYKEKNNTKIALFKQSAAEFRLKIAELEKEIEALESDVCNFQFESHDDAEDSISSLLYTKAEDACEGSHNCGKDEYTQPYQLIGDTKVYTAKLSVNYNRHDKTYYYVDSATYSYSE